MCNEKVFAEEFWNCADISVIAVGATLPPTAAPVAAPSPSLTPDSDEAPWHPESTPTPELATGTSCHQKECGCPDAQGSFPDATVDWCTLENAPKAGNAWCHENAGQCSQCGGGVCCADASARPHFDPTGQSNLTTDLANRITGEFVM